MKNFYSDYESQYYDILEKVLFEGSKEYNERTKLDTLRYPHATITVNLQEEFPILRTKKVLWKSALREILWIMQKNSNNINDLGVHIWDDWADENGSIGKAYGYQVGKKIKFEGHEYNSQSDMVLTRLKENPSDRRSLIQLWDVDELDEMGLVPCCYSSCWTIINGKLNCMLFQRSADFLVGVPFNTTQYSMLTILFARHLGVRPGKITHCMNDVHIYCDDSHYEGARKMLQNYKMIEEASYHYSLSHAKAEYKMAQYYYYDTTEIPELTPSTYFDYIKYNILGKKVYFTINSDETDFFKIDWKDCDVENYYYLDDLKFKVAV